MPAQISAQIFEQNSGQIYFTHIPSPVGPFLVAGSEEALYFTAFNSGEQQRPPKLDWIRDAGPLAYALQPLECYFAGEPIAFDIPLAPMGTPFQLSVWKALQDIPYGQTASYGDIASALQNPGASRAVGRANNANPLPVVIPCHRVIGADGSLTGFGGGMAAKITLLKLEGIPVPAEQLALFR